MRQGWARRMSELLAPGGILVCLEFPLHKDVRYPGPPWPLQGVYWDLLAEGGTGVVRELVDESSGGKGAFDRIFRYKPKQSYPQGQGKDMVGVWSLKKSEVKSSNM